MFFRKKWSSSILDGISGLLQNTELQMPEEVYWLFQLLVAEQLDACFEVVNRWQYYCCYGLSAIFGLVLFVRALDMMCDRL